MIANAPIHLFIYLFTGDICQLVIATKITVLFFPFRDRFGRNYFCSRWIDPKEQVLRIKSPLKNFQFGALGCPNASQSYGNVDRPGAFNSHYLVDCPRCDCYYCFHVCVRVLSESSLNALLCSLKMG